MPLIIFLPTTNDITSKIKIAMPSKMPTNTALCSAAALSCIAVAFILFNK